MAPIKEFSSADLNTISRLSGVSNVLVKVNGATVAASSFSGLLDTYTGAAAAYSVRKLDKDYTGYCMRIVVDSAATVGTLDSSDPEFDIGFDTNGDLDTAEIVTRCNNPSGGNYNAYVTKWYDQSGNGNDAAQAAYASMPQIYNGSAVLTQGTKPALKFDGSNDHFDTTPNNPLSYTGGVSCIAAVYKDTGAYNSFETLLSAGASGSGNSNLQEVLGLGYGNYSSHNPKPTFVTDIYRPSGVQYDGTLGTDERRLLAWYISNWSTHRSTGLSNMTLDGVDITTKKYSVYGDLDPTALLNNPLKIGVFDEVLSSSYFGGSMQEIILYANDENNNRRSIEGNVNAYFQIGNFGTPTSGFLSESYGTGAAAAYSVRQLANTASKCMRVRRDTGGGAGDDDEQDFGFDANGDLDTAAIATFVGSGNNGYVSKWYDQSGNQNDAAQNTHGSQPQIYNGSAVITENGKPAVDYNSDVLTVSGLASADMSNQTVIAVCKTDLTGAYRSIFRLGATSDTVATRSVWVGINNNGSGQFGSAAYNGTLQFGGSVTSQALGMYIGVDGGNGTSYVNGTQGAQSSNGTYRTSSGAGNLGGSAGYNWIGTIQEVIIYPSAQSNTNRSAIETNIDNYFNIPGM
tara:strand:- start:1171 stop:3057 length:1887 start_codon:yes stop_codon:yes gene_type:complete